MDFFKASLAALALAFLAPSPALSCACCAEPGARFSYDLKMEQSDIEELAALREGGPARLYMDACGSECVQGISEIADSYGAQFRITDGVLQIAVARPAGTITMVLPTDFRQFGVDTDPLGPGYDRLLYNEFTYAGEISADGIFAPADRAQGMLVLAGQGNMCWSVENYSHWILQVTAPGVDFQLYGALRAAR